MSNDYTCDCLDIDPTNGHRLDCKGVRVYQIAAGQTAHFHIGEAGQLVIDDNRPAVINDNPADAAQRFYEANRRFMTIELTLEEATVVASAVARHRDNGYARECGWGRTSWEPKLVTHSRHSIDTLIDASSIGEGLRNIRENGIDAELARLEAEPSFRIGIRSTRKAKGAKPSKKKSGKARKKR